MTGECSKNEMKTKEQCERLSSADAVVKIAGECGDTSNSRDLK